MAIYGECGSVVDGGTKRDGVALRLARALSNGRVGMDAVDAEGGATRSASRRGQLQGGGGSRSATQGRTSRARAGRCREGRRESQGQSRSRGEGAEQRSRSRGASGLLRGCRELGGKLYLGYRGRQRGHSSRSQER